MNMAGRAYITDYGGNEGQGTIILLHGFLSSSAYWNRLRPLLSAAGYRVVTIDLLGFGKSPKPKDSSYSYDEHLRHIRQALGSLELAGPPVLAGHSMGAALALRYGRTYPDAVKALLLLHPPLYKDSLQARATLRNTGMFYRALLDSRLRRFLWIALRYAGPVGRHNWHSRENSMTNIIEKAETLYDLQQVHLPGLLLVGAKDRSEYLANLRDHPVSTSLQVVVEPVGHHSPRLRPKLVFRHIHNFLQNQAVKQ